MSRVLLEFNGMRVDIKDPISSMQGSDEEGRLCEMVDQAMSILRVNPEPESSSCSKAPKKKK